MNLAELKLTLDAAGVPASSWSSMSDGIGEVYRIAPASGLPADGWEIWYSERGIRTGLRKFSSEDEACGAFLEWLLETR